MPPGYVRDLDEYLSWLNQTIKNFGAWLDGDVLFVEEIVGADGTTLAVSIDRQTIYFAGGCRLESISWSTLASTSTSTTTPSGHPTAPSCGASTSIPATPTSPTSISAERERRPTTMRKLNSMRSSPESKTG